MNNQQFEKYISIPQDKFTFVETEGRFHDHKIESKPVGYIKDAFRRFAKNKASIVAACIILILVLFAIVGPYFIDTDYTKAYQTDSPTILRYRFLMPKLKFMEGTGVWDGTMTKDVNDVDYYKYRGMAQETGLTVIHKVMESRKVGEEGSQSTLRKVRFDTYNSLSGYELKGISERASQSDIAAWVNGLDLPKADAQPTQNQESKVLVAYFSMPETTNPNNMTTEEDNSVVVINGEVLGNTQYMAQVIQRAANADIYRIEPQNPYPTDHTTLVAQAREEQDQDSRPAIKDAISNFDSYDTIFVGYPIWWSDLPQILYTFFDTYDFSGKTVIPFSTHGGSSFAGTPATIQRLEPGAKMLDGLTISRNSIQDAEQEIISWVNGLNY